MYYIGVLYEFGSEGLLRNRKEALKWYYKIAEAGGGGGMYRIGLFYEKGQGGLKKDKVQALEWYKKAAAAGNEAAKEKVQELQK